MHPKRMAKSLPVAAYTPTSQTTDSTLTTGPAAKETGSQLPEVYARRHKAPLVRPLDYETLLTLLAVAILLLVPLWVLIEGYATFFSALSAVLRMTMEHVLR